MGKARLYTYAESPVKLVHGKPDDPRMAAGYVAGMPGVNAAVRARAELGALVAEAVLESHVSDQKRTSRPRIVLVKGDRTDYHINMIVEADGDEEDALAAAYSIEYGRGGYTDSKGRRQPPAQGTLALTTALAAMGGF